MEVYRQYQHVIDKRKIFLQHVYEEFDEIPKVIADQRLSAYFGFIKSMIYTLTVDLDSIISESLEKPLTPEKMKQFCVEIFKRAKDRTVGYLSTLRYKWYILYGFFYRFNSLNIENATKFLEMINNT